MNDPCIEELDSDSVFSLNSGLNTVSLRITTNKIEAGRGGWCVLPYCRPKFRELRMVLSLCHDPKIEPRSAYEANRLWKPDPSRTSLKEHNLTNLFQTSFF